MVLFLKVTSGIVGLKMLSKMKNQKLFLTTFRLPIPFRIDKSDILAMTYIFKVPRSTNYKIDALSVIQRVKHELYFTVTKLRSLPFLLLLLGNRINICSPLISVI